MKALILSFAVLTVSLAASAQTMETRRIKREMIERTFTMENTILEASAFFKAMKLKEGCEKIVQLQIQAPAHMLDIYSYMTPYKKKIVQMQDDSLEIVRGIDLLKRDCANGPSFDKVDPTLNVRVLGEYKKEIRKHRKIIAKYDTNSRYDVDLTVNGHRYYRHQR